MKRSLAAFVGVAALSIIALAPSKASAGWGWWGGPGVSINIGPRYGYLRLSSIRILRISLRLLWLPTLRLLWVPSLRLLRWILWLPSLLAWPLETPLAALALTPLE